MINEAQVESHMRGRRPHQGGKNLGEASSQRAVACPCVCIPVCM